MTVNHELLAEQAATLLTAAQQERYQQRIADLLEAAISLDMVGSPADVSNAIGQFQFLKGKIETYQDILNDHDELTEQLQAATTNSASNG